MTYTQKYHTGATVYFGMAAAKPKRSTSPYTA